MSHRELASLAPRAWAYSGLAEDDDQLHGSAGSRRRPRIEASPTYLQFIYPRQITASMATTTSHELLVDVDSKLQCRASAIRSGSGK